MMTQALAIARLEWIATARLKWIRVLMAAFGLLGAAAAYSAGAANDLSGADGFARTTMALVPIVLILVPLAALVLGISGQATDVGSEAFLFAQPIDRRTVMIGRWLGESAALAATIAGGLGIGCGVAAFGNGPDGVARFAFFVLMSVVLGVNFLAVASAIAAATEKRVVALGFGVFAWCFFVLVYDGAALSVAGWANGPVGARVLFGSVFANPADLMRLVTLLVSGTPNVLGAAGESWVRFLGGATSAGTLAALALTGWVIAPLALGARLMRSRDL